MKIENSKYKMRVVGIGTTLALGCLGLMLISPISNSNAHADCLVENGENCARSSAELDAEVAVGTSIAIGIKDKVLLDLTPASNGATSASSTTVQVSTNSVEGYALYIRGDSELKNTSTVNNDVSSNSIKALTTSAKLTDFPINTYAYALGLVDDSTVFAPVDTVGNNPAKVTTTMTSSGQDGDFAYGDSYDLTFAVKIGINLPTGIYAGKVTISAVANPETVKSLAGLEFMQDMTQDICNNTRENYTKRLTDTRDGKQYWVAKLADGKCWMTQNLALDIYNDNGVAKAIPSTVDPSSITRAASFATLTNENTNIDAESVDLESTKFDNKFLITGNTQWSKNSWNVGKYVLIAPQRLGLEDGGVCRNGSTGEYSTPISVHNGSDFSTCAYVGFMDVSGDGWRPTFAAAQGTWSGPEKGVDVSQIENNGITTFINSTAGDYKTDDGGMQIIAADTNAKVYDAHYLVGNYYQFNTVVAGNGGEGASLDSDVVSSICPKGWRLPRGGYTLIGNDGLINTNTGNEFAYVLYKVYGYDNQVGRQDMHTDSEKYRDITMAPMHLVNSGLIRIYANSPLVWAGNAIRIWSSMTGANTGKAFFLNTEKLAITAGDSHDRFQGQTVRCIAE